MTASRSFSARNAAQTRRLLALCLRLDESALSRAIGDGWTVSAALAHLAYWDRQALALLDDRVGSILPQPAELPPLPPGMRRHGFGMELDALNDQLLPGWRATAPWVAIREAVNGAAALDERLAALDGVGIAAIVADGGVAALERWRHRAHHLATIERCLSRATPKAHRGADPQRHRVRTQGHRRRRGAAPVTPG